MRRRLALTALLVCVLAASGPAAQQQPTPPSVWITAPLTGASYVGAPATVQLSAGATAGMAADGVTPTIVTKVDYYSGTTLLGTATTAPYSVTWSAAAGVYFVTAVATDSIAQTATSTSIVVTVTSATTVTPWQTGDVFVGIGDGSDLNDNPDGSMTREPNAFPGHYRVFNPQGVAKTGTGTTEPDLVQPGLGSQTVTDSYGLTWGYTSGCAIDSTVPTGGHLWTTTWNGDHVVDFDPSTHGWVNDLDVLAKVEAFVQSSSFSNAALLAGPDASVTPPDPSADVQEVESIALDKYGNYFVGMLIESQGAFQPPKHYSWLAKLDQGGNVLGAWRVATGMTGVDWIDIANDQTTIYYTSEDQWIRWVNTAPNPDGSFSTGEVDASALGSNPGAIRILPPGDSTGGFLVASFGAVYRLGADGHMVQLYGDPSVTGTLAFFGLNLTPDGQYFWTATAQTYDYAADPTGNGLNPAAGKLYKFHIASGTMMAGPIDTGSLYANGICVMREYTAAQNTCITTDFSGNAVYVTDANGNPIIDPVTGQPQLSTFTCQPIPDCTIDPTNSACQAPGSPTLTLADVTNYEGDAVNLQLHATDPRGLPLTFTITQADLPPGGCPGNSKPVNDGGPSCPLATTAAGLISGEISYGASSSGTTVYTVHVSVQNSDGQKTSGSFNWRILHKNGPPYLFSPGNQILTLVKEYSTATCNTSLPSDPITNRCPIQISVGDPDAATDAVDVTASYVDPSTNLTMPGLPPGLTMPSSTSYGNGWLMPISGTPTQLGAFAVHLDACDCEGVGSHTHVGADFTITVRNLPPVFGVASAADQTNLSGAPVSYTIASPLATDPDGHNPIAYSATGLPPGITMDPATGVMSGTPTAGVNAQLVTVIATDAAGAQAVTPLTFHWTIYAPPVVNVSDQLNAVGTVISTPLQVSSPNGHTLSVSVTGLPPGVVYNPATNMIAGTLTAAVDAALVTVTATDTLPSPFPALTTTKTFTWRVEAPPSLALSNQLNVVGFPASYTPPSSASLPTHALVFTAAPLPDGILLTNATTGTMSGTPTGPAVVTVAVTVTDTMNILPATRAVTGTFTWTIVTNRPPVCSLGVAAPRALWPPDHKFANVSVLGVTDPDPGDTVTIRILSIWQDEPLDTTGDGHTEVDGAGIGTSTASVRAERRGDTKTGRLYQINFSASDGKPNGTCTGIIYVGVPHDQGQRTMPVDTNHRWDSITGAIIR